MEQLDTEVVETVAGVARLLDAQLSWYGRRPTQPVPGHRINYSRWGSILQRTRLRPVASPRPGARIWRGLDAATRHP
jgi:hypothetical protein